MKAWMRFLVVMGMLFLIAPASWGQATCASRDLSRIGETNTYVDTVDRKVSVDSVTNQKITTYRLRVSYKPAPTSDFRICITKEPETRTEVLRPPQSLPPVPVVAPTPPPVTEPGIVNPPVIITNNPSCWRRVSWCYIIPAALAAGGTALVLNCVRTWCNDDVRQDVFQSTTFNGNVSRSKRKGVRITLLSVPLKP